MSAAPRAIDQVTLTVIDNAIGTVCMEMAAAMRRTAYSPIFNEGLDFTCVMFDRHGELIGQAEMNPALIAPGYFGMRWLLEEVGAETLEPGDVVVMNDPYRGCAHLPEHTLVRPIFDGEALLGFAGVVAHVSEIGGMAVGSFAADAVDVFQEGLRLPPVLLMRRGEYVRDIWRVLLSNHRTPDTSWGDFHAMLGALHTGERRMVALIGRYGADRFQAATRELCDHAERWVRSRLRDLPDGTFRFEDQMDDDGTGAGPIRFRVAVTIDDDEATVDYTGTDPQARGPVNTTYVVAASAAYNALFQLIGPHVPRNGGTYRPITIIAPPGSAANVSYPGPSVGGQTETHPRLLDMIQGGALSQVVPERVAAAGGGSSCNFLFGGVHPDTGDYYAHYHFEGIGWGGRATTDGNESQCVPHGNCQNTPVEILETRFPILHGEYALRTDSGGAGRTRGGRGTRRTLTVRAPEMRVSALFDRTETRPWGLFGGGPGDNARVLVRRAGETTFRTFAESFGRPSPSKFTNVVLQAGDEVLIDSPGGGGYGPPDERDPERVADDVAIGAVSREAARDLYRVAVHAVDGVVVVDADATRGLRSGDR
jgi:N-methylhydantoinase B/oxoprolinase/acetone carboxylase alpha subunit